MQRVASSTRGSGNASVGQASRQRRHVPQRSASNGWSGASVRSVSRTPMKVNDPSLGTDQHRVLAEPPEAGAARQLPLRERSSVHVGAEAAGARGSQEAPGQPLELVTHHGVVVVAEGVPRDPAAPGRGLRSPLVVVVQDHDGGAGLRPRSRRLPSHRCLPLHVPHLAVESQIEPAVEGGRGVGGHEVGDAAGVEAELERGRLDRGGESDRVHGLSRSLRQRANRITSSAGRDRVLVAVGGVHPPSHVFGRRQRQERRLAVPAAATHGPGERDQVHARRADSRLPGRTRRR